MAAVSAAVAESPTPPSRAMQAAILLALLLAFGLLLAAASGDLWLDEIWSIDLARQAHTAWDMFTVLHHDNNHPLNTLYLYFLGSPKPLLIYRFAAVFSGMGCIALIGYTAQKQWGEREALLGIVLTATCFPLLLYFTEARGYALETMLAVAAYVAWRQHLGSAGKTSLLAFWSASILGLLAHGTFVIVMIAFAFGQMAEKRGLPSISRRVFELAKVHLLPMLFAAWWYLFFLRNMIIGGGDPSGGWAVIGQASSLLLGLPDTPAFHLVAMLGVLSVLVIGVNYLRRAREGQWLFFLSVLLIAPAMLLGFTYPHNFYFRYFLVSFPFFLLLSSHLICVGWQRFGNSQRGLLALGVAVFLAGNVQRDYFLLKIGRGQYSAAIEYMLRQTPRGQVRVGSDHDFRNRTVLEFYASRLPDGDRLSYVDQPHLAQSPPEWFLLHSQNLAYVPPAQIGVDKAGAYSLVKRYGFAGVSGWSWFLYRRSR
jgi:hypothetical protein